MTAIACHGCDLLIDVSDLADGNTADCPRCGGFLTRFRTDAFERVAASAVAAMICLILAGAFPFLSFAAKGLESVMTLGSTPQALWQNGMPEVAVLVAAFIIIIPAVVLILLALISFPLARGKYYSWLQPATSVMFMIQGWAMVEVFIIGVIVSLVKIAAMATVVLGISFWAYTAFAILFTFSLASLDRFQCWEQIERLEKA